MFNNIKDFNYDDIIIINGKEHFLINFNNNNFIEDDKMTNEIITIDKNYLTKKDEQEQNNVINLKVLSLNYKINSFIKHYNYLYKFKFIYK
jgi:hypothetical protein